MLQNETKKKKEKPDGSYMQCKNNLVQLSDIPLMNGKLRQTSESFRVLSILRKLSTAGLNVSVSSIVLRLVLMGKGVGKVLTVALTWGKWTNGRRLIIVMVAKRGFMVTLSFTPVVYAL